MSADLPFTVGYFYYPDRKRTRTHLVDADNKPCCGRKIAHKYYFHLLTCGTQIPAVECEDCAMLLPDSPLKERLDTVEAMLNEVRDDLMSVVSALFVIHPVLADRLSTIQERLESA